MKGESKVKLYGTPGSPFSLRVELALKVKGIAYEYVEEDLKNKSESLIKYNPVHKKVPVLVHNGKPVAESLVILEYIDETWKNHSPRFLPDDPYKRARVRFWASFLHLQLFESMRGVIITDGEAQEKAIKEVSEKLKMVEEEGMVDFFPSPAAASSISYESLELHHIVLCSIFASYKAAEEAIGVKLIDPEKNPLIYSWVTALNEMPAVKETKPSHEKTVGLLKFIRQNALQAAKA